jgi:hypothetical protein
MLIFDFYSGTGSSTKAFEDAGHRVIKVELDEYFEADERDILALTAEGLIAKYGQPDFIWASPPCTAFSVAGVSHHFDLEGNPKSETAVMGITLLEKTLSLISELNPKYWVMENPRGMMRKNKLVQGLKMNTVTYCQYGDTRMKPTDLWNNLDWTPKPMCKNGDSCHDAAPRGSRTGTQGLKNSKLRSQVPLQLSQEILGVITKHRSEQDLCK